MRYQVIGEGKPLVLIHGWLCSGAFWDDFHVLGEKGYKVIIPDLRGHGFSDPAKDVKIETLGEDINRLLEALNIEKAIIIGQSMGGLVTQSFYHNHPEKVIALGLWDTGGRIPFGYGFGTLAYIFRIFSFVTGLILSYPIPPLFRFTLAQGWKLSFKEKGKSEAYKQLVGIVKNTKQSSVVKAAIALSGFKELQSLKDIKVPTMLLHGCADRNIAPIQLAKRMQAEIPDNNLYYVKEGGHFPANEQPAEVLGYLEEFLQRVA